MDEQQVRRKPGLQDRLRNLKADTYALYLSYKDPRVPWYAKVLVAAVVAYAASPIDLIPDFIPVLGYLDDLVIIPLGVRLALKLIPQDIYDEHRARATEALEQRDSLTSWIAAIVIVLVWIAAAAWGISTVARLLRAR